MILYSTYQYITLRTRSVSATPTHKKNHAAGMAISYLPPEKPLAGAARRQAKGRPKGRPKCKKFRFGAILR